MSFRPWSPDPAGAEVAVAEEDRRASAPLVSRGRSMLIHASLVLFALAIIAKAVQVQILDREKWVKEAFRQHVNTVSVTPRRGSILDDAGNVLAESRELMRLQITPHALGKAKHKADTSRVVLRRALRNLGVRERLVRRAMDTSSKPIVIPGLFAPAEVEPLLSLRAVTATTVSRRFASAPSGIRTVLGSMDAADEAQGGIEQELDPLLRGVRGRDSLVRDARGYRHASPALSSVMARPGRTVLLTMNRSLQEIAERELLLAVRKTGASGGDVVILDPRDGAILALAGMRDGQDAASSTPLTDPYEPGSVMKPFMVARLLDDKRTTPDEMINTEGGKWREAGRVITDEHVATSMPVRDVIRLSSNIGVAKLSQRFSQREEYEALRDFGFGTYTGVPYPAESRGRLPIPEGRAGWSAQTPASLAMGYELSATPLQIAAAYAAIANGGEMLQPVLVKEVRDANGTVVYRHQRRVLRRVISETTARTMRTILKSVVDSGTSRAALLATYDVAGKSGTARRASGRGGYVPGGYNATFVEMFPEQAPQYVIVAKLIDPKGADYFGGSVSGSLVNGIVQAALATRSNSLNRTDLARYAKPLPTPAVKPLTPQALAAAVRDSARFDSLRAPAPRPAEPVAAAGRVVVVLPLVSSSAAKGADSGVVRSEAIMQEVPSVYGLDTRQAVRTLIASGFQVRLGRGGSGETRPVAGTLTRAGSTVVLLSLP